jgi:hypothetical protein
MRRVGLRREPAIAKQASGLLLIEGARFNESIAHLARTAFVPKRVFRYKSHDEANSHAVDCLVRGMGLRALKRE